MWSSLGLDQVNYDAFVSLVKQRIGELLAEARPKHQDLIKYSYEAFSRHMNGFLRNLYRDVEPPIIAKV
jgi:hypothetical protein